MALMSPLLFLKIEELPSIGNRSPSFLIPINSIPVIPASFLLFNIS